MSEITSSRPAAEAPKLDDLMLAMDVVDTLRHQELLVERELGQGDRDAMLRERLRGIYEGQGLEVSDRILNQGIADLKESRFVYEPRGGRWARAVATLWVQRVPIGIGIAAILVVIAGLTAWSSLQRSGDERRLSEAHLELTQTLPAALTDAGQSALSEVSDDNALGAATRLIAEGEAALTRGDAPATRKAIDDLRGLRAALIRSYELRIVSRPGESTGIFRVPDANQAARNYYLVVEAITPSGEVLTLPVRSEEDGSIEQVSIWAVRVPRSTFDAVAADKQADGIVDGNRLGVKRRGSLTETYLMEVEGGRIRTW